MRFARFAFSLILSASLILCLCLSAHAAADESPMTIYCVNTLYHGPSGSQPYSIERAYFDDPTSSGTYQFSIPGTVMENQIEYEARSINIIGYPDIDLWQQGYIYTFMYEIRVPNTVTPEPSGVVFTFGVATLRDDDSISIFQALGDVIHTYSVGSTLTTYLVTSTVYVDESFNGGAVGNLDSAYCSLEMSVWEQAAVNLNVRLSNVKAQKAIGEDAYYQASVDALNDLNSSMNGVNSSVNQVNSSVNQVNNSVNELNQSVTNLPQATIDAEYEYTLNMMPDDEGNIESVTGDVDELTVEIKNEMNGFNDLLATFTQREPCIYMPDIIIPLGDDVKINLSNTAYGQYVTGEGYFLPMSYLENMNPNIMNWINTAALLVRFVALISFFTYGMWKMLRLEWWVN